MKRIRISISTCRFIRLPRRQSSSSPLPPSSNFVTYDDDSYVYYDDNTIAEYEV